MEKERCLSIETDGKSYSQLRNKVVLLSEPEEREKKIGSGQMRQRVDKELWIYLLGAGLGWSRKEATLTELSKI